MKRLLRPLLVGLLLWLLAPFPAVAQPVADSSQDPELRLFSEREFSYEDLARYILRVRPEVAERPISLVFLWNRTDSVNGLGAGYQVLPNVWKEELLGRLLDNFLVHAYEREDGVVAGDRVMMLEFGQQRVKVVVPDQPFTHASRLPLKEAYPEPFTNTPVHLQYLELEKHMDEALAEVEDLYRDRNLLMLVLHDGIEQGTITGLPQAKDYRTYTARLSDELHRGFVVYFYWNDFPDERTFLYFDEASAEVMSESRSERVEAQDRGERPDEFFGDDDVPPAIPQETLSVTFAGDGSGRVWSAPDGIDTAAGHSSAGFNRGAAVSLTAEPSGFGAFGGFGFAPGASYGCGPGSSEVTCLLTMDAARAVTVTFVAPPPFNWVPLLLGVLLLALIAFVLRTWLLERYIVRDERGLLDRSTNVFPGRSKRIAVPNPADPNEPIGHLMVARPLPFGFSRLRFTPAKGYVVTLQGRGRAAQRATSKKTKKKRASGAFHLLAGQRKPERHELRYRKGDAGRTDGGPMDEASDVETSTTLTNGVIVLSVQHVSGSTSKRKRKGRAKPSDANESGGGKLARTGRRSRRRFELTDTEEGAPG